MPIEVQLTILIGFAIALFFAAFTKYLLDIIARIRENAKASGYGWTADMTVEAGCEVAEKMFGPAMGKEKFKFVLNYVEDESRLMHVKFIKEKVSNSINRYVKDVINADLKEVVNEIK